MSLYPEVHQYVFPTKKNICLYSCRTIIQIRIFNIDMILLSNLNVYIQILSISPIILFIAFLFPGTTKCCRIVLNVFCPRHEISHLFKKHWFLLGKKLYLETTSWALGILITSWLSLPVGPLSRLKYIFLKKIFLIEW